jgi:hypothetical protein
MRKLALLPFLIALPVFPLYPAGVAALERIHPPAVEYFHAPLLPLKSDVAAVLRSSESVSPCLVDAGWIGLASVSNSVETKYLANIEAYNELAPSFREKIAPASHDWLAYALVGNEAVSAAIVFALYWLVVLALGRIPAFSPVKQTVA